MIHSKMYAPVYSHFIIAVDASLEYCVKSRWSFLSKNADFHSFDLADSKNLCPKNMTSFCNLRRISDSTSWLYRLCALTELEKYRNKNFKKFPKKFWIFKNFCILAWTAKLAGRLSELTLTPDEFTCASSSRFRFWHFSALFKKPTI